MANQKPKKPHPKITAEDREVLSKIRVNPNIALVRGEFDGEHAVFIASVTGPDAVGDYRITPLAVALTADRIELLDRCTLDAASLVV